MAKHLIQLIIMGTQVVGRAFTRALKQEIAASQAAANVRSNARSSAYGAKSSMNDVKLGIDLDEAIKILNIDKDLNKEEVEKNFQHLFEVNAKSKGGSFYIQSKVVRAKERIDEEFKLREKGKSDSVKG